MKHVRANKETVEKEIIASGFDQVDAPRSDSRKIILSSIKRRRLSRLPDFCVAKVVKTFGCIDKTTETLDEFRYIELHSVD